MSNIEISKPIDIKPKEKSKCRSSTCDSHEIYRGRFCKECCRFNSRMYYRRSVVLKRIIQEKKNALIDIESDMSDTDMTDTEFNV